MAKIINPLLSLTAQGTVGDLITFTNSPSGPRAIRKPRTFDNTPAATRQAYADACAEWQTLTAGEKADWVAIGALRNITGFNAFISDRLLGGGSPPVVYTTWDPAKKDAAITLSNGNLTASQAGNYKSVIAIISKSSGKWYWEVTCHAEREVVGVGSISTTLAGSLGDNTNSRGVVGLTGALSGINQTADYGFPAFGADDIVGCALDMDAGELSYSLNGVDYGVAFDSLSGEFFPGLTVGTTGATANFGASAFAYTVPEGYQSGFFST